MTTAADHQAALQSPALSTPFTQFNLATALAAYDELRSVVPLDEVWFAVKAAPIPELIRELHRRGSAFDVASAGEIDLCLANGVPASRLRYGNPIRTPAEIAHGAAVGVTTWIVDTAEEVERIAALAPHSRIVIRLASDGAGSDWPLSGKFGCAPAEARDIAHQAQALGLRAAGLSWHVGSQQRDVHGWDRALRAAAHVWHALHAEGITMDVLDLGGGWPGNGCYRSPAPPLADYAKPIIETVDELWPHARPVLVAEPGRSLVAAAGTSIVTVKAVATRPDGRTYVVVDGGVFNLGLVEAIGAVIEYRIEALGYDADAPTQPIVLCGPSCDSLDEIAARTPYHLAVGLQAGDRLAIYDVGSYSFSYAAQFFNGYLPAPLVLT